MGHRTPSVDASDAKCVVDPLAHAALYEDLYPRSEKMRTVDSLSVAGHKHSLDSGLAPGQRIFLENCDKADYGGFGLFSVVQNNYGQGLTIRKLRQVQLNVSRQELPGDVYQYGHVNGIPRLRNAIAGHIERFFAKRMVNPEAIVVLNGTYQLSAILKEVSSPKLESGLGLGLRLGLGLGLALSPETKLLVIQSHNIRSATRGKGCYP